jgi:inosose dehydratase
MSNNFENLGIQSWCYREFKEVPHFITHLKKAGVAATEVCGVQIDFSKPAGFAGAIKQFKDAGVDILSIGVQGMNGDVAKETNYFEFVKAAGAKHISVSFSPDGMWGAFKTAEKLAKKYGVRLGIHNHGGYDWLGNSTILDYVFRHTGESIGLCLDTAWAIDAKQNPIHMVEKFGSRITAVHIKDFVYSKSREPKDVVIGTGNLDLPGLVKALKKVKFAGPTIIEYEGDAANPVPALKKCVNEYHKVLKSA